MAKSFYFFPFPKPPRLAAAFAVYCHRKASPEAARRRRNAHISSGQNVDMMALCSEGKVKEALSFMSQGVSTDRKVFRALLDYSKSLEIGKRVHEFVKRSSFDFVCEFRKSLIEMYGDCGSLKDARKMFDRMSIKCSSSWCSVIEGYMKNRKGDEGLVLFEEMKRTGLRPDAKFVLTVFFSLL